MASQQATELAKLCSVTPQSTQRGVCHQTCSQAEPAQIIRELAEQHVSVGLCTCPVLIDEGRRLGNGRGAEPW